MCVTGNLCTSSYVPLHRRSWTDFSPGQALAPQTRTELQEGLSLVKLHLGFEGVGWCWALLEQPLSALSQVLRLFMFPPQRSPIAITSLKP